MIKKGFTLVELLVVIAILAIAGTFILTIFTSSLRGSNKSQIVSSIKQNGQSVLETIDKTIRNSDNIVCPPVSGSTVVIVKDGIYTRYRFIVPTADGNGSIQQDAPLQPAVSDIQSFINTVCADPLQTPNVLTDTNPRTGVSASNGLFTRTRQPGSKDSITIKFDLSPGIAAPQVVAGQIDPVTFQTTIQLR